MQNRNWLAPAAVAVALGLLAKATAKPVLLEPAGIALVVALGMLLIHPRRDRFDLSLLREIDEQEQVRNLDPDAEVDAQSKVADSVMCPRCHHVFGVKFGACPNCGTLVG